jgi:hypothetical protein
MTGRLIIADVTSHRRGFGVQPIIDAAARRAQTSHDDGKVLWLVPSHLTAAFNLAHSIGNSSEIRNCDIIGPPLWALIRKEIESVVSTTPDIEITVVTWDQFVYGEARNYGRGIVAAKWFDWLAENRTPHVGRPQFATPLQSPQLGVSLPSADLLRAEVLTYLKSVGATCEGRALYRSQLRPALIRATPELRALSSHPLFASSFKMALDTAIADKAIGQECSAPGKERIWVVESACAVSSAETPPAPEEVSPVAQSVATAPTYVRSAQFRKRLTDLGIFCEKRERDILFEALGQLLNNGPQQVSRLRRELPKIAKQIADQRKVCPKTDFSRIVNFFLKLLLVSGALTRGDGIIMERNTGAESTAVTGLVEGALDVVESYLLEQILKKSDVKDREHWQLALALFREFDQSASIDDKLDRIASLIAGLGNRVILTDDGTYEYTGNVPTAIRPIRAQG